MIRQLDWDTFEALVLGSMGVPVCGALGLTEPGGRVEKFVIEASPARSVV